MVRNLGSAGNELKMPMRATDGRVLTWEKWAAEIIGKVVNKPQSTDDCWFVKGFAGDMSGYPTKKLAPRGNQNKWRVYRMMFFMMHPDQLALGTDPNLHCAHRCSRAIVSGTRKRRMMTSRARVWAGVLELLEQYSPPLPPHLRRQEQKPSRGSMCQLCVFKLNPRLVHPSGSVPTRTC